MLVTAGITDLETAVRGNAFLWGDPGTGARWAVWGAPQLRGDGKETGEDNPVKTDRPPIPPGDVDKTVTLGKTSGEGGQETVVVLEGGVAMGNYFNWTTPSPVSSTNDNNIISLKRDLPSPLTLGDGELDVLPRALPKERLGMNMGITATLTYEMLDVAILGGIKWVKAWGKENAVPSARIEVRVDGWVVADGVVTVD